MGKSLINVEKETREALLSHMCGMKFDDFFVKLIAIMDSGAIEVKDAELVCRVGEHPLLTEFKAACESCATDWEYGLRKATNAIREKRL